MCPVRLGELFEVESDASCFDVAGWFGNYYPYKYDLAHYIAVNSVTRDHLVRPQHHRRCPLPVPRAHLTLVSLVVLVARCLGPVDLHSADVSDG